MAGCGPLRIRDLGTVLALLSLPLAGCGDGGGLLTVQIQGLRADAARLNFKIYRADCLGAHPCDTWLAQTPLSQQTTSALSYPLRLPAEVLELPVHLRIETTQFVQLSTSCIGARATTTTAKQGSEYAGASLSIALNRDSMGPVFTVKMPNACPFRYTAQGRGSGTVSLSRSGYETLTDSRTFPDEFPRGSVITATAMPSLGSKFSGWAAASACPMSTAASCPFTVDDQVTLSPIFELE